MYFDFPIFLFSLDYISHVLVILCDIMRDMEPERKRRFCLFPNKNQIEQPYVCYHFILPIY